MGGWIGWNGGLAVVVVPPDPLVPVPLLALLTPLLPEAPPEACMVKVR